MTSRVTAMGRLLRQSRGKDQRSLAPVVRSIARPVRGRLLVISLLSIVVGLAESGILVLLAQLAIALSNEADDVQLDVGPSGLPDLSVSTVLVVAFALTVLRFAAVMGTNLISGRTTAMTAQRLRHQLLGGFFDSSWDVKAEDRNGHLQELTLGVANQAASSLGVIAGGLSALFTFVTLGVAAFAINPWMAGALIVVMTMLFFLLRPLSIVSRSFTRRLTTEMLGFANDVNQAAGAAQEIQVFGVDGPVSTRLMRQASRVERSQFRRAVMRGLVPAAYQSAALLLIIAGLGAINAFGGEFASLSAIVLLFVRGASYGQQLQTYYQQVQDTAPYTQRLEEAWDRYRAHERDAGVKRLPRVERVEFRHVSFAYESPRLAVDDLDFSIERGEVIGVVGPSGAGKSTLVQLLLRLRDPDQGAVLVNGEPAGDFSFVDWARRVTYVSQHPTLLATSIGENISFFRDDVDAVTVRAAARRAHLHDEIEAMPEGYATWVGDDGRRLSGGQRQRVTIARALAGKPDLLILDEPTSALDMRSEVLIQQTLEELKGEVTLVIIAHRLSTLSGCNRIMVLGDGRLQAFGSPSDVLATNAFYRQAVELSRLPQ